MNLKKIQNDICSVIQTIAMIGSCVNVYRDNYLGTILLYLLILVIEFTIKDRKGE